MVAKHLLHSILPLPYLKTPIWTESNEFSRIYWWVIGPQNCIDAIAEIFDLSPKNRKTYCMRFFFVGYTLMLSVWIFTQRESGRGCRELFG